MAFALALLHFVYYLCQLFLLARFSVVLDVVDGLRSVAFESDATDWSNVYTAGFQ